MNKDIQDSYPTEEQMIEFLKPDEQKSNESYNTAIDDAISVIWKHRFVYTGAADLVEKLTQLKRKP